MSFAYLPLYTRRRRKYVGQKKRNFHLPTKKNENLPLHHVAEAAVKPLEGHVEDGHYEEEGDGSHQHTAGTSHTQGDVTVGTYAMREYQRQHTEYHGERSHQDRTQTHTGSRHGSHRDAHTLAMTFCGILGKQNGCLGQQTYEHNQTRLHVDIVLQAPHPREEEATQQTKRHAQDNSQGDEKALVQGT